MSIETARTGKPSRYLNDEGRKERTEQPLESAQRSGGVSGDGMLGRADGVTREACPRGAQAPTPGTTLETRKAEAARAGVGVLHSSEEAPENGVEQRRGSSDGAICRRVDAPRSRAAHPFGAACRQSVSGLPSPSARCPLPQRAGSGDARSAEKLAGAKGAQAQ